MDSNNAKPQREQITFTPAPISPELAATYREFMASIIGIPAAYLKGPHMRHATKEEESDADDSYTIR